METIIIYRVASHNKSSRPDGREEVFRGTPAECDRWYNELTHTQVVTDAYLFGDAGADSDFAVGYYAWPHAGCAAEWLE